MKHFISTILPTMLLCMSGAKAYAYDIAVDNADGVTIYYNIINDDKELEVTYHYDYNDYMHNFDWYGFEDDYVGSVVIPEEVTYSDVTRKVTKIGNSAFAFCIKLTSVTIPNGVTAIGSSEHHARHATARGRQPGLLDTNDAGVARVISREVACKRQPVLHDATLVASLAL